MDQLWAPWRLEYIISNKVEGCIFCEFPKENEDEENLILYRGNHCFVIMNAFPYSNGHLMVAPYKHTGDVTELNSDESLEMMQLMQKCCNALKEIARPDGFNIGINMGTPAGAGIADHIHLHIVPRWNGDTNFMPVLADTKIIPESLKATYKKLKPCFEK